MDWRIEMQSHQIYVEVPIEIYVPVYVPFTSQATSSTTFGADPSLLSPYTPPASSTWFPKPPSCEDTSHVAREHNAAPSNNESRGTHAPASSATAPVASGSGSPSVDAVSEVSVSSERALSASVNDWISGIRKQIDAAHAKSQTPNSVPQKRQDGSGDVPSTQQEKKKTKREGTPHPFYYPSAHIVLSSASHATSRTISRTTSHTTNQSDVAKTDDSDTEPGEIKPRRSQAQQSQAQQSQAQQSQAQQSQAQQSQAQQSQAQQSQVPTIRPKAQRTHPVRRTTFTRPRFTRSPSPRAFSENYNSRGYYRDPISGGRGAETAYDITAPTDRGKKSLSAFVRQ